MRAEVVSAAREMSKEQAEAIGREYLFLLESQRKLQELNEKYFPQSGMTQQEIIEATAKRVGLNMPKTYEEDAEAAAEISSYKAADNFEAAYRVAKPKDGDSSS